MPKYGYLQEKKYPVPEISIEVISPAHSKLLFRVDAIVDSGASKTCLPKKLITGYAGNYKLAYGFRDVTTATGKTEEARSYFVDIKVSNFVFQDIEVLALSREYALLGRDILNSFILTLDGPGLVWDMKR